MIIITIIIVILIIIIINIIIIIIKPYSLMIERSAFYLFTVEIAPSPTCLIWNFSRYFTSPLMLHHSLLKNQPSIIFSLFILFLHIPVRLFVFSKFSLLVCSIRSSAVNFHASPSSYLEHNSSKLEVSLSQKGSMKYKHPITEERSLFFTFSLPCSHFVNTEKPKVGWMRNFPSFTLAGRKYTPCHWW